MNVFTEGKDLLLIYTASKRLIVHLMERVLSFHLKQQCSYHTQHISHIYWDIQIAKN